MKVTLLDKSDINSSSTLALLVQQDTLQPYAVQASDFAVLTGAFLDKYLESGWLSNDDIIKGVKEGSTSITYTDLFGTSCTHNYTIYARELPNGEQNLEDFDYNTEHYQYGFHSWYSDMNKPLPALKAEGKNITFGVYKTILLFPFEILKFFIHFVDDTTIMCF